MFKKLINFLIKKQVVTLPDDGYLAHRIDRYTINGLQDYVCINVINQATEDLHTHPWDFLSIVLWGGYIEGLLVDGHIKYKRYAPISILYRKHDDFHVIKPLTSKAITLFIKLKNKSINTQWMRDGVAKNESLFWLKQGYKKQDLKKMYHQSKAWVGLFE